MIIEIPATPPSVNSAYYFTKMKGGRIIKVKNTKAKEWVNTVKKILETADYKTYGGDVVVYITLYFDDHRRHDVDNYQKITLDAMTGTVWLDDNQIVKVTTEKFHAKERKTIIEVNASMRALI